MYQNIDQAMKMVGINAVFIREVPKLARDTQWYIFQHETPFPALSVAHMITT